MHNLKAITPLGGDHARKDTVGGVTIREITDRALASLGARLGQEDNVLSVAAKHLGFDLPIPGQWSAGGDHMAWWMGPDLWMIDADHDAHETLAGELKSATGFAASVVEQTDGWCRFDLDGTGCFGVLERLCNANIRAMDAGAVTRTSIEHLGCFLLCLEAGQKFSIVGPRSSAGSLHHALMTAARSAG